MKKILVYYSFIVITLVTTAGFFGSRTIPELISAVLFFPLAVYFGVKILPKKQKALSIPEIPDLIEEEILGPETEPPKKSSSFDADRRMFIKLIGSAGLSVFLLSIFTKRAGAAFFGSVPGPGTVALKDTAGVQIDPSQHHPTDGYKISELDDSSPAYYGFVRRDGAWFIMKEGTGGDYRYSKGSSSFSTNWTNRASLSYNYFDVVF